MTYGSLDALGGDDYLQNSSILTAAGDQGADDGHTKVLSAEDLGKRGLPTSQKADDPRWVAVESSLLDKVRINLTTQNLKTVSGDSVLIVSVVDSRFVESPNFRIAGDRSRAMTPVGTDQFASTVYRTGLLCERHPAVSHLPARSLWSTTSHSRSRKAGSMAPVPALETADRCARHREKISPQHERTIVD